MQNNITRHDHVNNFFSQNSNISSQTVAYARLEVSNADISKRNHYEIIKIMLNSKLIKPRHASCLRAFIMCSDSSLVSRASIMTIAVEMGVTERTVINVCSELENMGLIERVRTGYKKTNKTTLTVVQHLLSTQSENFSSILQFLSNLIDLNNNQILDDGFILLTDSKKEGRSATLSAANEYEHSFIVANKGKKKVELSDEDIQSIQSSCKALNLSLEETREVAGRVALYMGKNRVKSKHAYIQAVLSNLSSNDDVPNSQPEPKETVYHPSHRESTDIIQAINKQEEESVPADPSRMADMYRMLGAGQKH